MKTAAREAAVRLRLEGRTYDEIAAELGVSKSSCSLWLRDLPRPRWGPVEQRERARQMSERRWGPDRQVRDAATSERRLLAAAQVGVLNDRELLLLGAVAYWCEGAKSKPWRRQPYLCFVNSDPGLVLLFLRWLRLVGASDYACRVCIHERADIGAAERYWADLVGVGVDALLPTTLERHNAKTVRKNTGEAYRGA